MLYVKLDKLLIIVFLLTVIEKTIGLGLPLYNSVVLGHPFLFFITFYVFGLDSHRSRYVECCSLCRCRTYMSRIIQLFDGSNASFDSHERTPDDVV